MTGTTLPTAPWSVGPWTLEPRGLGACGNAVVSNASTQELPSRVRSPPTSANHVSGATGSAAEYSNRLSSLVGADTVVSRKEVAEFLDLAGQGGENLWEVVSTDARTEVKRHRDRSLCGGVFVRLSAHIPSIHDVAHAAACYMDFEERERWDKQIVGFKSLHRQEGTDVLYYTMHVPPLSDRDFVVFHTIMRHESGKGLLLYMRHADPAFVPATRAVRGCCYVTAVEIMEHSEGGISVTVTSAIDPKIPFLPKWIINALVPSEWRKSVAELEKHCHTIAAEGKALCCAALFQSAGAAARAEQPSKDSDTTAASRKVDDMASPSTTEPSIADVSPDVTPDVTPTRKGDAGMEFGFVSKVDVPEVEELSVQPSQFSWFSMMCGAQYCGTR